MRGKVLLAAGALCCAAFAGGIVEPSAEQVRLAAGFSTNAVDRIVRDFKIEGGLADSDGIEFDFLCDDLSAFSSFTVYFKSGKGWYVTRVSPEREGEWQRILVRKSDADGREGTPEGWKNVTAYRLACWRGSRRDATVCVANAKKVGTDAQVLVVRSDGSAKESSNAIWAKKISNTMLAMGVNTRQVSDVDLDADMLAGVKVVVLPHNTGLPDAALTTLKGFVDAGGRLLVCYVIPWKLRSVLGLKSGGSFVPDGSRTAISGFLRAGEGLPGQPEFSPQGSWRASIETPVRDGKVVAYWADPSHKSLGVPAIIRVPAGIYISHIWNGGVTGAPLKLMQSILTDLAPSLKSGLEAHEKAFAARLEQQRSQARRLGLKERRDEVRAAWCHTPYGYDAEHDWEKSVRLMKETGYTDLIANLCWGGMAFYRSNVLPVAPDVERSGDALDLCLAACRRHGVRLHVWKVCWRMGSKVTKEYREQMTAAGRTQVMFDGSHKDAWFCPSHPENQRVEVETMIELSQRGVDGVHFDYIRYDGGNGCFCAGCRERFERKCGHAIANWPAEVRANAELKRKWHDFRRENISTVVRQVAERLHGHSRTLISAAVFNSIENCRESVGQDWTAWCRNGWLDFVCPMDYTSSTALFRSIVRSQMPFVGKTKIYPGIGLSCWPEDGEDIRRLAEKISVTRELGTGGFTVFALSTRAEAVFPAF